jgi:hypothetical protein
VSQSQENFKNCKETLFTSLGLAFDMMEMVGFQAVLTILDACRWAVASQVLDLPSVEDIPEDHNAPKQQHAQYSVQRNQSVDGPISALDHSVMTNNTLVSGR